MTLRCRVAPTGTKSALSTKLEPLKEGLPKLAIAAKSQGTWVHQWQYLAEDKVALVSFAVLDESHWHDLTYGSRIHDWTIRSRTEYVDPDGGAYIVAEHRKDPNQFALLVFSVIFEDGTWAKTPNVNLISLKNMKRAPGVLEKATIRIAPTPTQGSVFSAPSWGHTRVLQCQVLVSNFNSEIASELDAAIQLHVESRQHGRFPMARNCICQLASRH